MIRGLVAAGAERAPIWEYDIGSAADEWRDGAGWPRSTDDGGPGAERRPRCRPGCGRRSRRAAWREFGYRAAEPADQDPAVHVRRDDGLARRGAAGHLPRGSGAGGGAGRLPGLRRAGAGAGAGAARGGGRPSPEPLRTRKARGDGVDGRRAQERDVVAAPAVRGAALPVGGVLVRGRGDLLGVRVGAADVSAVVLGLPAYVGRPGSSCTATRRTRLSGQPVRDHRDRAGGAALHWPRRGSCGG